MTLSSLVLVLVILFVVRLVKVRVTRALDGLPELIARVTAMFAPEAERGTIRVDLEGTLKCQREDLRERERTQAEIWKSSMGAALGMLARSPVIAGWLDPFKDNLMWAGAGAALVYGALLDVAAVWHVGVPAYTLGDVIGLLSLSVALACPAVWLCAKERAWTRLQRITVRVVGPVSVGLALLLTISMDDTSSYLLFGAIPGGCLVVAGVAYVAIPVAWKPGSGCCPCFPPAP